MHRRCHQDHPHHPFHLKAGLMLPQHLWSNHHSFIIIIISRILIITLLIILISCTFHLKDGLMLPQHLGPRHHCMPHTSTLLRFIMMMMMMVIMMMTICSLGKSHGQAGLAGLATNTHNFIKCFPLLLKFRTLTVALGNWLWKDHESVIGMYAYI